VGVMFKQSARDFPLTVSLGEKYPSWGLSRWRGNKGLRFIPSYDEGFSLRGDNKRLVYRGKRCSHRFTILGDAAFEYDCILEREPESNVISILMEGADGFDFFKQPDFLAEQLIAGSYAVYKKETLVGEGTGKLCHIYRPLIIDAKGRRCRGDLSIVGNELRITIPEWWLSEAAYPVVVDPTVGTSTAGSQYQWRPESSEPLETLYMDCQIAVNRFMVPETINGTCTAYVYTNADDIDAGGRAVFYSDSATKPVNRLSKNENLIDLRVGGSRPAAGWRSGSFSSNRSISSGSYIWFGVSAEYFWYPRFDTGLTCYAEFWSDGVTPNNYPKIFSTYNFRLSMYFTYTTGQNYARTLTQGVKPSDNRVLFWSFKRAISQTVQAITGSNGFKTIYRKLEELTQVMDSICFPVIFLRSMRESITGIDLLSFPRNVLRKVFNMVEAGCEARTGWVYIIRLAETTKAICNVFRGLLFFIRIQTGLFVRDYLLGRFLKAKSVLVLKSKISRELILESKIM